MANRTDRKTKIRSNKWKNENKNGRRFTRSSEPQPSTDGFWSSLTSNTKRTSPRSIKTVFPHKKQTGTKFHTNINASTPKQNNTPATPRQNNTPATPKQNNTPVIPTPNNTPTTPTKKSHKSSIVSVNSPTSKNNNKPVKKAYVVFVGNLPYGVTKEQLEEHFRKTGGVEKIRIPKERGTERGRGFAYVEFKDRISHKIGLRLHHTHLGGRQINVEFTSIGGNNSKRREKLAQKNLKLNKMRKEFYPS